MRRESRLIAKICRFVIWAHKSPLEEPPQPAEPSEAELRALLTRLETEHRNTDREITALLEMGVVDRLKIKRMKKIKLAMKDKIVFLRNQLTPDIIA